MRNRCLLAISSLFLAVSVSGGVAAGRTGANIEVDSGTAFSRLNESTCVKYYCAEGCSLHERAHLTEVEQ